MPNRLSTADLNQQFAEFNARSGKFIILLSGVSGLPTQPTLAQVVALEIATNTGYSTRPALNLGTPTASGSGATAGLSASQGIVITAGAALTYDGYALIWGGTSALGNTTGNLLLINDTIGTISVGAGLTGTLTVTYTKIAQLG